MKLRMKLALRNIFRHRGRTVVSLMMVAGAVVGLVFFMGFSAYILGNMRRIVIDNEYGHIQIADKSYWDLATGKRKDQLIAQPELLNQKIAADPDVETVSGRLSFFGLVSSGETTISAKGMGFDPSREKQFAQNLKMKMGEGLGGDSKLEVILGVGLQKKINVPVGGSITVLSYTLDGVVNAMDLTVKGVFATSNAEIDNNVFMLPLATVQTLLDTESVEVLSVRLKDNDHLAAARARLQEIGTSINPGFQIKTWYELSTFYRQVESFYQTQNRVIEVILLSLVFLGIMNTIGMSVVERTGEIGTVRALGESNFSVVGQFVLEGLILGTIGALLGAAAGYLIGNLISSLNFMMDLPGTSDPIPIKLHHMLSSYFQAMIVAALAAVVATWLPALRATKLSIVEALRRNI